MGIHQFDHLLQSYLEVLFLKTLLFELSYEKVALFLTTPSLDGVGMGQRWAGRAVGGQVYGSPEDGAAGLVPEHGRWRDLADQHVPQKGQEVGGSNPGSSG